MKSDTKKIPFNKQLKLECGKELQGFELMVETYGELNSNKDNAVLVCHAFSGNHHAVGEGKEGQKPGWWNQLIGSEKTINTQKYDFKQGS